MNAVTREEIPYLAQRIENTLTIGPVQIFGKIKHRILISAVMLFGLRVKSEIRPVTPTWRQPVCAGQLGATPFE
jgi:hypothetical protein